MQSNKSCGTKPELALGRLLWSCGIRYRKHTKSIMGRPDFSIKKYKLAVFVDGEFWHGKDWEKKKSDFRGRNRDFWIKKIERNIERDRKVTAYLTAHGWRVFRFWESEIKRSPGVCVGAILRYLSSFYSVGAPQYIPMDYVGREELPVSPVVFRPYEIEEESSLAAEPEGSEQETMNRGYGCQAEVQDNP